MINYSPRSYASDEYWIYSTGQKRCLRVWSKVNWFGWNMEHSEYIVGGWSGQILGAIRAVSTAWEPAEFLFFFRPDKQLTISTISRRPNFTKFGHKTSIAVAMKTSGTDFWKFYHNGSVFQKKFLENFYRLATPQWLQIARNSLQNWPSTGCLVFIFYR